MSACLVAIKPQILKNEAPVLAGFAARGALMISIAAGTHTKSLFKAWGAKARIIRAMPNTPGAIAPWGGATAVFGTNPIAFACPLPDAAPIVVDLSLSKVARGNILAARQKGERIPEGWALDAAGKPTTDPQAALAGTMLPLGDAKGTALALMVELLAAGLTGANYAAEATSFLDAEGPPPGTGQLIIAIDPAEIHESFIRAAGPVRY